MWEDFTPLHVERCRLRHCCAVFVDLIINPHSAPYHEKFMLVQLVALLKDKGPDPATMICFF